MKLMNGKKLGPLPEATVVHRAVRCKLEDPVRLGARGALGSLSDVIDMGHVRSARIFVGRNKGVSSSKECRRAPRKSTIARLDELFETARATQIGARNIGATRYLARGIYEGAGEDSVVYEVIDTGADGDRFEANMDRLAQIMAWAACQKEIYVDFPGDRNVHRATF